MPSAAALPCAMASSVPASSSGLWPRALQFSLLKANLIEGQNRFLVCNYIAAGNVEGEYRQNVFPKRRNSRVKARAIAH